MQLCLYFLTTFFKKNICADNAEHLLPMLFKFSDILDKESPQLFCPSNQTNITESGQATTVSAWTNPIATDNSNVEPNITCFRNSEKQFKLGYAHVHCIAEDKSGNIAECDFIIDVKGKHS